MRPGIYASIFSCGLQGMKSMTDSPQLPLHIWKGLTAIHDANFFNGFAARLGNPVRDDVRGSELNQGKNLQAVHPVIRTNRKY